MRGFKCRSEDEKIKLCTLWFSPLFLLHHDVPVQHLHYSSKPPIHLILHFPPFGARLGGADPHRSCCIFGCKQPQYTLNWLSSQNDIICKKSKKKLNLNKLNSSSPAQLIKSISNLLRAIFISQEAVMKTCLLVNVTSPWFSVKIKTEMQKKQYQYICQHNCNYVDRKLKFSS